VLRAGDDVWVVIDDILGQGANRVACQWLLAEGPHEVDESANRIDLKLPVGELRIHWAVTNIEQTVVDLTCGDEAKAPRGWRSRYYGVREPALSLQLAGAGRMPCRIATVFTPGDRKARVRFEREKISVSGGDGKELELFLSSPERPDSLTITEARLIAGGPVETLKATRRMA
jgi:hypothetical protein